MKQQLTPEQALILLKKGSDIGFAYFFNKYYSTLVWYSASFIFDKDAAHDIVHESFLIFNDKCKISSDPEIKKFLYTTVRNKSLDFLRRAAARGKHHNLYTELKEATYVNNKMIESETYRLLRESVQTLPPLCREVTILYYFGGFNTREIAKKMNRASTTIAAQLQRGRLLLKRRLAHLQ